MTFHAVVSSGDKTCMKIQILCSGKNNKHIINLSSAEIAQGEVNVNLGDIFIMFRVFFPVSSILKRCRFLQFLLFTQETG